MTKATLLSLILAVTASGAAYADGSNTVVQSPLPKPLTPRVQQHTYSTGPTTVCPHHGPAIHYGHAGHGQIVHSSTDAGQGTVTCAGNYVTTGPILRTETMQPYVESVEPIIIVEDGEALVGGHAVHVAPRHHAHKHHADCGHSRPYVHKVETGLATFAGDFTGGVGSNVGSYTSGGGVVVITGNARRSGVLSHSASRYTFVAKSSGGGACCRMGGR